MLGRRVICRIAVVLHRECQRLLETGPCVLRTGSRPMCAPFDVAVCRLLCPVGHVYMTCSIWSRSRGDERKERFAVGIA